MYTILPNKDINRIGEDLKEILYELYDTGVVIEYDGVSIDNDMCIERVLYFKNSEGIADYVYDLMHNSILHDIKVVVLNSNPFFIDPKILSAYELCLEYLSDYIIESDREEMKAVLQDCLYKYHTPGIIITGSLDGSFSKRVSIILMPDCFKTMSCNVIYANDIRKKEREHDLIKKGFNSEKRWI